MLQGVVADILVWHEAGKDFHFLVYGLIKEGFCLLKCIFEYLGSTPYISLAESRLWLASSGVPHVVDSIKEADFVGSSPNLLCNRFALFEIITVHAVDINHRE